MGVYDPEVICGEACEVKLECVVSIYDGITVFYQMTTFGAEREIELQKAAYPCPR